MILLGALLGAVLGSFINVVIYRIPRGKSLVSPPSSCPQCHTRLGVAELVPVVSFLALRGRCRHCRAPIAARYVVVELLSSAAVAVSLAKFGLTVSGGAAAVLLLTLIALSAVDIEHFLLPDRMVLAGVLVGLPLVLLRDWPAWSASLLGAAAGAVIFTLILLLSRGGMGGGDVKLAAMIGLYLGWQLALVSYLLAFLLGGLFGVALLLLGLRGRRDAVPFGPFLALGAVLALFFGESILAWYVGFL